MIIFEDKYYPILLIFYHTWSIQLVAVARNGDF